MILDARSTSSPRERLRRFSPRWTTGGQPPSEVEAREPLRPSPRVARGPQELDAGALLRRPVRRRRGPGRVGDERLPGGGAPAFRLSHRLPREPRRHVRREADRPGALRRGRGAGVLARPLQLRPLGPGLARTGRSPVGRLPRPDLLACCTNICQTVLYWYRDLARHFGVPLVLIDTPFVYGEPAGAPAPVRGRPARGGDRGRGARLEAAARPEALRRRSPRPRGQRALGPVPRDRASGPLPGPAWTGSSTSGRSWRCAAPRSATPTTACSSTSCATGWRRESAGSGARSATASSGTTSRSGTPPARSRPCSPRAASTSSARPTRTRGPRRRASSIPPIRSARLPAPTRRSC